MDDLSRSELTLAESVRVSGVPARPWYRRGPARWLKWVLFGVAPAPVLLAIFFQEDDPVGRLLLAIWSLMAAMGGLYWWQKARSDGQRCRLLPPMLLVTGLTILCATLWNHTYLDYVRTLNDRKEVFRKGLHRYSTPVYGLPHDTSGWGVAGVVSLGAVASVLVMRLGMCEPVKARRVAGVMVLQAAAIAIFAASEGGTRMIGRAPGLDTFRSDAAHFSGAVDLMSVYVKTMPQLSWFGVHYPPGSAVLFWIESHAGIAPWGAALIGMAVVLSTPFVWLSTRELKLSAFAQNATLLCYACSSGLLIYPTLSTTPVVVLPGAIGLWACVWMVRGSLLWAPAILAISLYVFAFFSFAAIFFAAALGVAMILMCLMRQMPWIDLIKRLAVVAAIGLCFHGLVRFASGFDLLACASAGVEAHHAQARTDGFDTVQSFFMRSSGNFLAFGLVHLPLVALATAGLLGLRRRMIRGPADLILPAITLTIVLCAVSGKFFLETDRIWSIFTPLLAIGAAVELARLDSLRARWQAKIIIASMIAFACTQEIAWSHFVP